VDGLVVGGRAVDGFEVEIGGLDYGCALNGILGMDLLTTMGAVLPPAVAARGETDGPASHPGAGLVMSGSGLARPA
jgi:hypothetical protein